MIASDNVSACVLPSVSNSIRAVVTWVIGPVILLVPLAFLTGTVVANHWGSNPNLVTADCVIQEIVHPESTNTRHWWTSRVCSEEIFASRMSSFPFTERVFVEFVRFSRWRSRSSSTANSFSRFHNHTAYIGVIRSICDSLHQVVRKSSEVGTSALRSLSQRSSSETSRVFGLSFFCTCCSSFLPSFTRIDTD